MQSFAPNADAACKALVETASQRWIDDDPTYRDDISAIVIFTPLDASKAAVSHETISYTADSALAVMREKQEAEKPADAPAPPAPKPAEPKPAEDSPGAKMSESKHIKASKAQRRRSVVTKFG